MNRLRILSACIVLILLSSSGCSVLMAANRSSYRGDVSVIQDGVSRSEVIGELGQPDSFSKSETGGYDDRYTLDPHAHRAWLKTGTILLHLGADVMTLGQWELVGTPYELAVRDRAVMYHLAYNREGKLVTYEKMKP
jgi:hypothetical protein